MIYRGKDLPGVALLPGCTVADNDSTEQMLQACQSVANGITEPGLVITHGTDGQHSGAADPHPFGFALDIRTHGLDALHVLELLRDFLSQTIYFMQIEDAGQPNEHLHVQVQKSLWPTLVDPVLLAEARAKDAAAAKENA